MKHLPLAGLLLLSLTACSAGPDKQGAAGSGSDTPAETASATGPAQSADPDLAARPANDLRKDSPARLDGFGGVTLGAGIAEVRSGFGTPLQGLGTDANGKPLPADDSNDGYGHAAGDAALRAFADEVARQAQEVGGAPLRRGDAAVAGRLGGEEFACLLPHGSRERAAAFAEALRSAVAGMRIEIDGASLSFTVSAGLAIAEAGAEVDALLRQADEALYEAKRGGRNRVVVAEGATPAWAA